MREILYRGKSIENGKWIEGYYFKHNPLMVCFAEEQKPYKHYIMKDGVCDWNFEPPIEAIEIDPETVGEFTELTDINGKKIFEGDIVKAIQTEYNEDKEKEPIVFEFIGEMIFEDGCFGLRAKHIVDFYAPMWEEDDVKLEVIGNIYDNPELLEVEE